MTSDPSRRGFLETSAAAAAFTIVPRHVLGGSGAVAPSDKITLAYIGVGTQGIRELLPMLAVPEVQIVAVCDPCKYPSGYRDWSKEGLLKQVRATLGKPDWSAGGDGVIPGGRDVAKDIIETYYARNRSGDRFRGCAQYADFRELLDKEKDLNAVKVTTPCHQYGVINIAAMKKGKHVIAHKPLANRLKEANAVIETARARNVATHLMPWDHNDSLEQVMAWIKGGEIGTLREVHNWSSRPMWPGYAAIPTDRPPVPEGFDWNLWLGPEADRPYHPNYTHMVFRGWYDFGTGTMGDMGYYSLWSVFNLLELSGPTVIEPRFCHNNEFQGNVAVKVRNTYSFPISTVVRFKFPARGRRGPVDLFWYDGGMKPPTPDELDEDGKEFAAEGMMFVGDKGKILGGFYGDNPRLIPERRMRGHQAQAAPPKKPIGSFSPGLRQWAAACRGGQPSPGNFLNAGPISEAVNLRAVALRVGRRLVYDARTLTVTNVPEANRYLTREYRKGWEI